MSVYLYAVDCFLVKVLEICTILNYLHITFPRIKVVIFLKLKRTEVIMIQTLAIDKIDLSGEQSIDNRKGPLTNRFWNGKRHCDVLGVGGLACDVYKQSLKKLFGA